MSDHSDVLYDHRLHTHTSCIQEISNVDMVILLIGSRFGGTAVPEALTNVSLEEAQSATSTNLSEIDTYSVTQVEVLKAIQLGIPLFAFVDAKVYSDHHLYQKNKSLDFSDKIIFPSIDKPETASYIFEFINIITHRFAGNAVTPYASFNDIENHLLKQWSLGYQRLLSEERGKAKESRRSDAILEQIQDLKAAVLQSMSSEAGKNIARSVLRFRRLVDFLLEMRSLNPTIDFTLFSGEFEELLREFGVVEFFRDPKRSGSFPQTILILEDDTHLRVRIPDRRFVEFHVEWNDFMKLDKDAKIAVLDGVSDVSSAGPTLVLHVRHSFEEVERAREETLHDVPEENFQPAFWTDARLNTLRRLWSDGFSAPQISEALGDVSPNAVIGKAHRLGLSPRSEG